MKRFLKPNHEVKEGFVAVIHNRYISFLFFSLFLLTNIPALSPLQTASGSLTSTDVWCVAVRQSVGETREEMVIILQKPEL